MYTIHVQYTLKSFLSLHRVIVLNLSFYRCRLQNQSYFSFYRFIVASFYRFLVRNIEFILSFYRFIVLSFYRCKPIVLSL